MRPVELLRHLVELESPTGDAVRMAHIGRFLEAEFEGLGGKVTMDGPHLIAEFGGGGQMLLIGHMDTVWPAGTIARLPFRVEGDLAHGPGSLDMKGGLVVGLEAIRRSGAPKRPLRMLITADEEVGSPSGRPVVERLAREAEVALVLEPPVKNGTITTQRSGLARYQLYVDGLAAHAGHQNGGISAIEELAHQTLALRKLVDRERGIRVNVGQIGGGTGDNVVAAHAWARIDARAWTTPDQRELEDAIRGLQPVAEGATLTVTGGITRPPMIRSQQGVEVAERVLDIAEGLGMTLAEHASGGGSDGNFAAAVGTPVVDGLGPIGAGAHADEERVSLGSIDQRADLLAALIERL